ncbi:hypothetical protein ALMP_08700 [Streptomyces sp. A012304]|nr:hypothetical protein ALMP_08700 [Streptomyces sp. A012304]
MMVAGLTAGALTAVAYLAFQASAKAPEGFSRARAQASPAGQQVSRDQARSVAPPAGSGSGRRVVYSVGADRVWLVGDSGKVQRTFAVTPGSVDPTPGSYAVTSRSSSVIGTDGTPVEHVVRFTDVDGVAIGFSAAVDGTTRPTTPKPRTGGIRESRPDGAAMWTFATIGQRVVVTP